MNSRTHQTPPSNAAAVDAIHSSRPDSALSNQDRILIEGQGDDDIRASAAHTRDFQLSVHLFNPLTHPGETQTVMSIFEFKSGAIITQFQANFLLIAA
jgi:hypothetical protein